MKLYYKPGACSLASHIALRETGNVFDLESVDTDANTTETGADFKQINPKGCVPALRLSNGEVLTESPAILQYIADQNLDADLMPKAGTLERARLQEHLNYISSELHKAFAPFFSPHTSEDEKKLAKTNVEKKMQHFETIFSDGREYLLGDKYTISDAYLFVVSSWTTPTGIGMDKWPNIAAFSTRIANRENVKTAMHAEGLLN